MIKESNHDSDYSSFCEKNWENKDRFDFPEMKVKER